MEDIEIGVKVDDSGAVESLNNINGYIDDMGDVAKKAEKVTDKALKNIGKDANKLNKSFKVLNKGLGKTVELFKSLGSKAMIAGVAGLTTATVAAGAAMKSLSEQASAIKNISDNTGIATDQLSKFTTMAKLAGGSVDDVADAVQDFTEKLGEAKFDPNSSWAQAFKSMGVSLDKNVNDTLDDTIKKLKKMVSEGKKSEAFFAGVDLFGDAYKRGFAQYVSGQTSTSLTSKLTIPPSVLTSFTELTKTSRETKAILLRYVSPYLKVVADGTNNMLTKLDEMILNTSPATAKKAREQIVKSVGGFLILLKNSFNSTLDAFSKMLNTFGANTLTIGMSIISQLGIIINKLAPLASLMVSAEASLNLLSLLKAGFFYIFGGASGKAAGRRFLEEKSIEKMKSKKSKLTGEVKNLNEDMDGLPVLSNDYIELLKARKKKEEEIAALEESIERITKPYSERKDLAKDAKKRLKEAKKAKDKGKIKEIKKEIDDYTVSFFEGLGNMWSDIAIVATDLIGLQAGKKLKNQAKQFEELSKKVLNKTITASEATIFKKLSKNIVKNDKLFGFMKSASQLALFGKLIKIYDSLDTGFVDELKTGITDKEIMDFINSLFSSTKSKTSAGQQGPVYGPDPFKLPEYQGYSTDPLLAQILDTSELTKKSSKTTSEDMGNRKAAILGFLQQTIDESMSIWSNWVDWKAQKDEQAVQDELDRENRKIDNMVITDRRRRKLQEAAEAKADKKRQENAKKQKAVNIASVWMDTGMAIAGLAANAFKTEPPFMAMATFATMSPLLMANAVAQTALIASQSFANSGFVGAKGGKDNQMVNAREGELFLNGRDQRDLYERLKGRDGYQVHIENFSGNDEDLERFENVLRSLESNGRISQAVFA